MTYLSAWLIVVRSDLTLLDLHRHSCSLIFVLGIAEWEAIFIRKEWVYSFEFAEALSEVRLHMVDTTTTQMIV